ncbi:MAG: hypothetical protein WB439_02875 [Acidobacteriaceae bacterium]
MPFMDRRRFLLASAATAALPSLQAIAHAATTTATLKLHSGEPGPRIPENFIGLSYETNELTNPSFFSLDNTGLIHQFRELSFNGVLRIGGNTSDIGYWKPTPDTKAPDIHVRNIGGGEPTSQLAYSITPEAIHNLHDFLHATGWTCIYGINLGTNTPGRAALEAAYVAQTLGFTHQHGKLEYFQLGNEPDLFSSHLRDPKTWSPELYMDEWLDEANAIRAAVPAARFGLPDTAGNPEWYAAVVSRLLTLSEPPDVAALTHHYYIGGPPSNPQMTIDYILSPNPKVGQLASDIREAAARLSAGEHRTIPYRMTEGNTCYRGGKPGVSDVFAASLWAADYLLDLASHGYAGVNFHGGTGKYVGNSLGGHLPGDDIVLAEHGDPSKHPHPYYTPIAHIGKDYVAEPIYYGMLFANHFAGATTMPIDFNPGSVNATAYAATLPTGQRIIALINKDRTQSLNISLPEYRQGPTLTAPALDSTQVRLAEPSADHELSTLPPSTAVLLYAARP